jgi:hypothetical protein
MMKIIESATNPEVRALLLLQWSCAARVGDISQLYRHNVQLGTGKEHVPLTVFFTKGKVIGRIDPYHVHTALSARWAEWLAHWMAQSTDKFLFQKMSKAARMRLHGEAKNHVRTVCPQCDLRSVRRGAAQTMAAKGLPMSTILLFTRHTDVKMLRRYLRFGKAESEESRKGVAAAALALWPKQC